MFFISPAEQGQDHGEAVSTAVFTDTNDHAVVVHMFATRIDRRRQGYGASLVKLLEKHAKDLKKRLYVEYVYLYHYL